MRVASTPTFQAPPPVAAPTKAAVTVGADVCMSASRTFSSITAAKQAAQMAAWTYGVHLRGVNVEESGSSYVASARFCDDGEFAEASLKSAVAFFRRD
jgi:hypothetical protein